MLILLWLSQIWPVTLKIQQYVFSGCTVPTNNNDTKLESSYQKLLHQLFPVVWTFLRSLGVICYERWVLSEGHKKSLQGLVSHELTAYLSVFNLFLTQWIMVILSKGCKPDNFESHNSLQLSFTNIWVPSFQFCWMWIFPWIKLSRHSCSMWDKLG